MRRFLYSHTTYKYKVVRQALSFAISTDPPSELKSYPGEITTAMPTYPDLTAFKALSFDVYGTLIDWESGLHTVLLPILTKLPPTHAYNTNPVLARRRFDELCNEQQEAHPRRLYDDMLQQSFVALADELGVTDVVADDATEIAPGSWAAFPDTVDALRRLRGCGLKLVALSNVSERTIAQTIAGPLGGEGVFDEVLTAERVGAYKPDHWGFEVLLGRVEEVWGVGRGELLHVARSLTADHVPAKELGLVSLLVFELFPL